MTFYSMHYRKKYSDPANKKWAARKMGCPFPACKSPYRREKSNLKYVSIVLS